MTTKTITLAKEKNVQTIGKGTVVKLGGDLFIVAELHGRNAESNPIENALFGIHKVTCRQTDIVELKYNLLSFMTGSLYYDHNYDLPELARKMSGAFKVVDKIEFVEFD